MLTVKRVLFTLAAVKLSIRAIPGAKVLFLDRLEEVLASIPSLESSEWAFLCFFEPFKGTDTVFFGGLTISCFARLLSLL
jgi:hypothetical protein